MSTELTDHIKFKPVKPNDYILAFKERHPNAIWQDYLAFFLENFPQQSSGNELNYIIEGGTAIKLLKSDRVDPTDIDIIDLRGGLEEEIGPNTRWFNTILLQDWIDSFGFDPEKINNTLKHEIVEVTFKDRSLSILSPELLAVTKMVPYRERSKRKKDFIDLKLLGFDIKQVKNIASNYLPS